MTALARHISDPDRSLARQLQVRSLPAGVRVGLALALAAGLLWPLAALVADALTADAWSGALLSATWFSLWQAALAATAGVALSIPLGWALARLGVPARRLVRALLTWPVVAPALGLALGSAWLIGGGSMLLVWANAAVAFAVGLRLVGAAWLALDLRQTETARTLGLGFLQLARWYYLPALREAIGAAWSLSVALALSAFGTAYLLAPASRTALPELAGSSAPADQPVAAAGAIVLTLLVALALALFMRCRPAIGHAAGTPDYRPLGDLARRDRALLGVAFAAAGLLALGPLFALLHATVTAGAAEQITGGNLAAVFEDARPLDVDPTAALRRSVVLGAGALIAALPAGFFVAVLIAPLRGWHAAVAEAALLLPLFLPVVVAAGLVSAGFDSASWLWLVHLGIAFPIAVRMLLPGVRRRMRGQFEAATVLGGSRWFSWNRLVARSLRAQLAVAAVVAFTWSLGESGAALLLHRVDAAPTSVAIILALRRQTASGDGLALALSGLLALFVLFLFVTIEYRRSREITEF